MNNKDITAAGQEAHRFLEKLNDYKNAGLFEDKNPSFPSPARSALKRSSMDLTRALSKMRKGE